MKLATFVNPFTGEERLGLLLADGDDPLILDANAFFARMLEEQGEEDPQILADALLPPTVLGYLRRGRRAEEAARSVLEEARRRLRSNEPLVGISGARVTFRQSEVRLKAPIPRPPKIVHTAGNFREHAQEAEKAGWPFPIPQWISFLKSPSSVIGPFDPIVYPKFVKELDYELEVAIVIGKRGKYIS
ncbi:MAG: fumarylacetoacetate hydrolase family protein, partial [Nitrososphaerota archaeon]